MQLEIVAKRLENLISFIRTRLLWNNDKATADHRRGILKELESTMQVLETRLPKSSVVYGTRGDLLRLQEMGIGQGINTAAPPMNSARDREASRGSRRLLE